MSCQQHKRKVNTSELYQFHPDKEYMSPDKCSESTTMPARGKRINQTSQV